MLQKTIMQTLYVPTNLDKMREFQLTSKQLGLNSNDYEIVREEALKEVVDIKCNNCGDYLKYSEVNEHSKKCLEVKISDRSTNT